MATYGCIVRNRDKKKKNILGYYFFPIEISPITLFYIKNYSTAIQKKKID